MWEGFLHEAFSQRRWQGYGRLGWRLLGCYGRLIRRYQHLREHQWVIVGYAGYLDVLLARLLNWRRRQRYLVLVAFISLYDTIVMDRGQLLAGSWKAKGVKWFEQLGFRCADLILVDTVEHGRYLAELYGLPPEKFARSFVGEDDDLFQLLPQAATPGVFRVLFFGTYVPLHGVEAVLEAAQCLRGESQVELVLIGKGQLYPQTRREADRLQLPNLRFIDQWISPASLREQVAQADVCLGIFGQTAKAARVIPLKVFDALALGRPVITRDSPAIRELLEHEKNALLCPAGDGAALAAAILRLRDNPALARDLAAAGHACFRQQAAPEAVARSLVRLLEWGLERKE
ncbi:MAG: glycosyltransferase [Candidatus Latescibacteria bacterium]|nr:glycosyltransferase [Candidatus Latescibacterota bacterium]